LSFDLTNPVISSVSSDVTSTTSTVTWTTDEVSNSSVTGDVTGSSSSFVTSHSIEITGLSASTAYSFNVTSCDPANNCANTSSSSSSFTTSAAPSSGGGDSGGGDSGGDSPSGGGGVVPTSSTDYIVLESELEKGVVNLNLKTKDKVSFEVEEVNHTLTVNSVGINSVSVTIKSEPVNLTLFVGDSFRLNLSSLEYYDTMVTLNGIDSEVANISIEKIHELIFPIVDVDENKTFYAFGNGPLESFIGGLFVAFLVAIVLWFVIREIRDGKILNYFARKKKKLKGRKS
jgi:hypothetical protein